MEYEIKLEDGRKYKFVDDGHWVDIYVNDEFWGCSDGDRFIRALLKEVKRLNNVVEQLQELL